MFQVHGTGLPTDVTYWYIAQYAFEGSLYLQFLKPVNPRSLNDMSSVMESVRKGNISGINNNLLSTLDQARAHMSEITHLRYLWVFGDPESVPVHAGYDQGQRRSLFTEASFDGIAQLDEYRKTQTNVVIQPYGDDLNTRYLQLDDAKVYFTVRNSTASQTMIGDNRWQMIKSAELLDPANLESYPNRFRVYNYEQKDVSGVYFRLNWRNVPVRLRRFDSSNNHYGTDVNSYIDWGTDMDFQYIDNDSVECYKISFTIKSDTVVLSGEDISEFVGQTVHLYWTDFNDSTYPDEIPPFEDTYGTTDYPLFDNYPHYLNWGGLDRSLFRIRPYYAPTDLIG